MLSHSFISSLALALLYHAVLVVSQAALNSITEPPTFVQSAAPELDGNSASPCGGCYLVADVAGLVWYSEVFVNSANAVVSVGVGNGTRATRTSVIQNEGAITFNTAGASGSAALTQVAFDPTVSIAGAILSSPTAYNVFTAYSITSAYSSDGICITTSGSKIVLSSAYSEILPSASGKVFLDANGQQQFINYLGFSTCSGGGENIVPTALIQVKNTTAYSTTTFSGILAAQSASLTIAPSSPASASAGPITSISFPSAAAPQIVYGNKTITPKAHPIGLPIYNGTVVTPSTEFGIPTGPSGNFTNIPVPFIGGASSVGITDGWLVAWIAGMVGLAAGVYYL